MDSADDDSALQKSNTAGCPVPESGSHRSIEAEDRVVDEVGDDEDEVREISLREWLDRPRREVNSLECLHIFRQIVEAVSLAHSQSVVVGNIRPSCFVMSLPYCHVSFIESASCSTSGSEDDDDDAAATVDSGASMHLVREIGGRGATDMGVAFPLKQILSTELNWYTSPEEGEGSNSTFASDIYRLGVISFELYCTFQWMEEKLRIMANLRHRVLPPQLLLKWPKEASFCLWLLHPQPETRPKMSEVLQSEFLNQSRDNLEERAKAVRLREDIEDQEMLLEFLCELQRRNEDSSYELHDIVSFISADIDEVLNEHCILNQKAGKLLAGEAALADGMLDQMLSFSSNIESPSCFGSRKRFRLENLSFNMKDGYVNSSADPEREGSIQTKESMLLKCTRVMEHFDELEATYLSMRSTLTKQQNDPLYGYSPLGSSGQGSMRSERSSVDNLNSKGGRAILQRCSLNPFFENLCKFLSFSKMKVKAELKQGDMLNSSNLICSLGFDRDKELFATAGVNKRIKVFECAEILNGDRDIHYPIVEMSNGSKLSSICWNSYMKNQIASGDFDCAVQIWDVMRSQVFLELREHEKRVWSVDFSISEPTKLISGGDDGFVKLWNINQAILFFYLAPEAFVRSEQKQMSAQSSSSLILLVLLLLGQQTTIFTAMIFVMQGHLYGH